MGANLERRGLHVGQSVLLRCSRVKAKSDIGVSSLSLSIDEELKEILVCL